MSEACPPSACDGCRAVRGELERLGLKLATFDHVVALAGNPNTGKSTLFNRLTGLRQHTGNWPGKTIARAEGGFGYNGSRYKLVDLPGTYSLRSASPDETVAREFLLFGQPDLTVVVADATSLERNLNLALQILQVTDRVVLALNLMDEARAHGIRVDARGLANQLGVPVVPCSARSGEGVDDLLVEIEGVTKGTVPTRPYRLKLAVPGAAAALEQVVARLRARYPKLPNAEWIALRLLEGDRAVAARVADGSIGQLQPDAAERVAVPA